MKYLLASCLHCRIMYNYKKNLCAAFISTLFACQAFAQNRVTVVRSGFDHIAISNNYNHAIRIEITGCNSIILHRGGWKQVPFKLSERNVLSAKITTYYDATCLQYDSTYCNNAVLRAQEEEGKKLFWKMLLASVFQGKPIGALIDLFRLDYKYKFESETEYNQFLEEITAAYSSSDPQEQKSNRMEKIIEKYTDKKRYDAMKENCLSGGQDMIRKLVDKNSATYQVNAAKLSDFIRLQEKSHFEAGAFAAAGFRARIFKGASLKGATTLSGYLERPSFTVRSAFVYNAYNKFRQRKVGIQNYITASFSQSRAIYKPAKDSLFTGNNAFSWQFVSLGYGSLFEKSGYVSNKISISTLVDIGVISSLFYEHQIANGKLGATKRQSQFKGIVPYINIGYKVSITRWLDIYGTYYGTFLYSSFVKRPEKFDLPQFRQWNVGLNFNFSHHYSYQY
jgi:hypothetical protein